MNSIAWFLSLPEASRRLWAVVCLVVGILFSVVAMFCILVFKALGLIALVVIGAPLAVLGSPYWFGQWIIYDRLWNYLLGGDFEETVSSRLGKWHYFDHPPVFTGQLFFLNQLVSLWLDQVDKDHIKTSIMPHVGVPVPAFKMARLNIIADSLYTLGLKI